MILLTRLIHCFRIFWKHRSVIYNLLSKLHCIDNSDLQVGSARHHLAKTPNNPGLF